MNISLDWLDRAACKGYPVSMFYPDRGSRHDEPTPDEKRAKRMCAQCPVRVMCLAYALTIESKKLVIGTRVFELCPECHGEDECEEPKHKPHPSKWDCEVCESVGEVAKQNVMSIKPQSSGIWGGWTANQRTKPGIRHLEDCDRRGHGACRPLVEQVRLLEEQFVARVHEDRILLANEDVEMAI